MKKKNCYLNISLNLL